MDQSVTFWKRVYNDPYEIFHLVKHRFQMCTHTELSKNQIAAKPLKVCFHRTCNSLQEHNTLYVTFRQAHVQWNNTRF